MDHAQLERAVASKSARIYLPIALSTALAFLLVSSLIGGYSLVARMGGTIWVALLTLIISMPIVTSRVKKKNKMISTVE